MNFLLIYFWNVFQFFWRYFLYLYFSLSFCSAFYIQNITFLRHWILLYCVQFLRMDKDKLALLENITRTDKIFWICMKMTDFGVLDILLNLWPCKVELPNLSLKKQKIFSFTIVCFYFIKLLSFSISYWVMHNVPIMTSLKNAL